MTMILGISGSLRRASYNTALLRAAAGLAPSGTTVDMATLHGIPLYDGDLEAEHGLPEPVRLLKERIVAADGLLLVTPEYNNAIPGVMKNAIDWLSRPASDIPRVFRDLPVAILGTTPGRGGTILAQGAWLPILRTLGTLPWFGAKLQIADAGHAFDEEHRLVDPRVRGELTRFVEGFARFVASASPLRGHTESTTRMRTVPEAEGGGVTQAEIRLDRHGS